jgi:hypothetical protein
VHLAKGEKVLEPAVVDHSGDVLIVKIAQILDLAAKSVVLNNRHQSSRGYFTR